MFHLKQVPVIANATPTRSSLSLCLRTSNIRELTLKSQDKGGNKTVVLRNYNLGECLLLQQILTYAD